MTLCTKFTTCSSPGPSSPPPRRGERGAISCNCTFPFLQQGEAKITRPRDERAHGLDIIIMAYLSTRFPQVAPSHYNRAKPRAAITCHHQRTPPIAPAQTHMRTPVGKNKGAIPNRKRKILVPWLAKSRIMIVYFHRLQHTSSSPSLVRTLRSGSICDFSQISC